MPSFQACRLVVDRGFRLSSVGPARPFGRRRAFSAGERRARFDNRESQRIRYVVADQPRVQKELMIISFLPAVLPRRRRGKKIREKIDNIPFGTHAAGVRACLSYWYTRSGALRRSLAVSHESSSGVFPAHRTRYVIVVSACAICLSRCMVT